MGIPSITVAASLPNAISLVDAPSDISDEAIISEIKVLQEKIHTLENTHLGEILHAFRNKKPDKKLSDEQITHILYSIINLPENKIDLHAKEIIQCSQSIAICKMALLNQLKKYQKLSDNLTLLNQKSSKEEAAFNDELKKQQQDFSQTQTTLNEKKEAAENLKNEINLLNNKLSKGKGKKTDIKAKVEEKKSLLTKLNEEINQLSKASYSQKQQLSQLELNHTINIKSMSDQLNSWRAQHKIAKDEIDQLQNQIEENTGHITSIFSILDSHLVVDKLSKEREKLQVQLEKLQAEAKKRKIELI